MQIMLSSSMCLFVSSTLMLFFTIGCTAVKMQHSMPTDALSTAVDELRHASVWVGSRHYGFAGESTNHLAQALDSVLESDDRDHVLFVLLQNARPAGQLYALCGLYHARPDIFDEVAERFRNNTNVVEGIIGDVMLPMRLCDIVFSPYGRGKGETNIILRQGQSVGAWLREQDTRARPFMDISGGGIPMMLRFGLEP